MSLEEDQPVVFNQPGSWIAEYFPETVLEDVTDEYFDSANGGQQVDLIFVDTGASVGKFFVFAKEILFECRLAAYTRRD
jgi:hypothetical protein